MFLLGLKLKLPLAYNNPHTRGTSGVAPVCHLMSFDKCIHLCNPNPYQNTEHYLNPKTSNAPFSPLLSLYLRKQTLF